MKMMMMIKRKTCRQVHRKGNVGFRRKMASKKADEEKADADMEGGR